MGQAQKAGTSESAEQALQRQQGRWVAVASRRDGQDAEETLVNSISRVVEADQVYWMRDGKRFAGTTIALDPSRDPKRIDVTPDGGPARDQRVLGIYCFEEDRLVICMADAGKPRPEKFTAESGEPHTLMTFRRAGNDDKKPKSNADKVK
jgi:uncharacterized protein (TIGR03067 family)